MLWSVCVTCSATLLPKKIRATSIPVPSPTYNPPKKSLRPTADLFDLSSLFLPLSSHPPAFPYSSPCFPDKRCAQFGPPPPPGRLPGRPCEPTPPLPLPPPSRRSSPRSPSTASMAPTLLLWYGAPLPISSRTLPGWMSVPIGPIMALGKPSKRHEGQDERR